MLLYVVKYGPGPLDPPIFNRLDQCQWGKLKGGGRGGPGQGEGQTAAVEDMDGCHLLGVQLRPKST